MFFSFAVHYAFLHNTIPSPVTVNPEIYQEFYSFLDNKKFDYKIEGENELESMQKIASLKRYDPTVISEIKNVKAVLEKEKQKEMNRPSLFIQSGIEQELGARYYGTKGRIESTFDHDPQIKSAVDIIKNKKKYREIFNPK
jgi:carboxyl-terminal processing protease